MWKCDADIRRANKKNIVFFFGLLSILIWCCLSNSKRHFHSCASALFNKTVAQTTRVRHFVIRSLTFYVLRSVLQYFLCSLSPFTHSHPLVLGAGTAAPLRNTFFSFGWLSLYLFVCANLKSKSMWTPPSACMSVVKHHKINARCMSSKRFGLYFAKRQRQRQQTNKQKGKQSKRAL